MRFILLPLLLAIAACSNPQEKAAEEAAVAEQYLRAGDLVSARQAIGRALKQRDDEPSILLLDAIIKFRMQDYGAAYDAFRVVLAIDPNNLVALSGVAQLGLATGNVRESRDAVERALAIDPRQPEVLLTKGVLAINRKDYDETIAIGEKLSEYHPNDPRGIVLRARGRFLQGHHDEAMALLMNAATSTGNNPMISTALLENAREKGDVALMREQFDYLRGANPGSVDLAVDECNVLYKSGDTATARDVCREALKTFGGNADAMQRIYNLWLEYDRTPLAGVDHAGFTRDLGIDARLVAARVLLRQGELAAAQTYVRGVDDARAAGLAARITAQSGKASGFEAARDILEDDRNNCEALTAIAEWNLRIKKPLAAIEPAQVVATQCLDRNDGFLLLGRAYRSLDRSAGTERVYREGIDTYPQDRFIAGEFAEWLLGQGRNQPAVSAARRLTKAAPARTSSWLLFERICQKAGDTNCVAEAREGLARAKVNYAIDLLPGERPVNPLLGRSWR